MNYTEINRAILDDRDVDNSLVEKDQDFYKYLLNNRVAYYYSKHLSTKQTLEELQIIARGENYTDRFLQTLRTLKSICEQNDIQFMLFKTRRYFDEPVDGDIDVLVREDQFERFLEVFSKSGFDTLVDEPGKGKCTMEGLCDIEPHVNISWRSNTFLDGMNLWSRFEKVDINGTAVQNVSSEIEILSTAGELYFSPEYLDLHRLKAGKGLKGAKSLNDDEHEKKYIDKYLQLLERVQNNYSNGMLPYFLSTKDLYYQIRNEVKVSQIAEILFKNYYWAHRYRLVHKLPFTHTWK